jgi:hypothetical protein
MFRKFLSLLVVLVSLSACEVYVHDDGASVDVGRSEIHGNGNKVTETRWLRGFSRVENRTALEVVVREAMDSAVDVTLDANLQRLLETRVQGDVLVIERETPFSFWGEGRVVVHLPRFTGARLASSGALTVEGVAQVNDVDLEVAGSGTLRYCGAARTLSAALEGSGTLRVCTPSEQLVESVHLTVTGSGLLDYSGRAKLVDAFNDSSGRLVASGVAGRFVARTRGSGDVDGRTLQATEAELTVQSSGDVLASSQGGRVTVTLQGSGNVELWGNAEVWVNDTGSGAFIRH